MPTAGALPVKDLSEKGSAEHLEVPLASLGVVRTDSYKDDQHINLTWRSWLVVFICCFAIMSQVFVVVAAGSVIGFIIRDISEPGLIGWIIQAPLLMQSVLSPVVGRLSDVLDRRYLAALPPLVAFAGAVLSAKANSINELIIGGILIGFTLSTIAIVQSIPSEILPLKYRALANGFAFLGGAVGGLVGGLGAGGLTNSNVHGWRNIFWVQAAFHLLTSAGFLLFYFPPPPSHPKMTVKQILWACDPIGTSLLIAGATTLLLALDWGGGTYLWSDVHVIAPMVVGFVLLIAFGLYEAYGRTDGIVAHVFFKHNNNFALSVGAFAIEGWIFYSAVNSVVPQIVLNLGFATDAWVISKRQLLYSVTSLVASIPISLYATKYKDLKTPLIATFALFFVVSVCYGTITPKLNKAQLAYNVLAGIGQAGPLTLLVALVQFTSPHAYLSTATGLAFSARAIGGAFGSAVLNAIINSKLASLSGDIGAAAIKAGLTPSSVTALVSALASGAPAALAAVPGVSPTIVSAAVSASHETHAAAYRVAYLSILPFIAAAIVGICLIKNVGDLMTEHVEASVENFVGLNEILKTWYIGRKHLPIRRLAAISDPVLWKYLGQGGIDLDISRTRAFRLALRPELWQYVHYTSISLRQSLAPLLLPLMTNLIDLTLNLTPVEGTPVSNPQLFPWTISTILRQLSNLRALSIYPDTPSLAPIAFIDETLTLDESLPQIDSDCLRYSTFGLPGTSAQLAYFSATFLDPDDFIATLCYTLEHVVAVHITVAMPEEKSQTVRNTQKWKRIQEVNNFVDEVVCDPSRSFRTKRLLIHTFPFDGEDFDDRPSLELDALLGPTLDALGPVPIQFIDMSHGEHFNPEPFSTLCMPSLKTLVLDRDDCDTNVDSISLKGLAHFLPRFLSLTRLTLKGWFPEALSVDIAACTTPLALALGFPTIYALLALLNTTGCTYLRLRHEYSDSPSEEKMPSVHFVREDGAGPWTWELYHPA